MNSDYLYEFLILSKLRSYSRAAEQLYISQPMLSRHIQRMEAELGTALLVRNSHSVVPTEIGRLLARQSAPLIEKCQYADSLRLSDAPAAKGHIRVACSFEISYASHLKSFLAGFCDKHAEIDVTFDVIPDRLPQKLIRDYDLLISPCNYVDLPIGVERAFIFRHGTYALLPPGHPFVTKSALGPHQLAGETLIVPYSQELFGPYARNSLLIQRSTGDRVTILRVPNLTSAIFQVSIGKGLLICPRYVSNMVPHDAFMIVISDASCCFDEYIYLNTLPDNAAARRFFDEYQTACRVPAPTQSKRKTGA